MDRQYDSIDMNAFPAHVRPYLIPEYAGDCVYECIACAYSAALDRFLYTCPQCGSLLKITDRSFAQLKNIPGPVWRDIFDYRTLLRIEALQGIFLFKELLFPAIPLQDVVCLGEGHTALVRANEQLARYAGCGFFIKNDGFNPSGLK